LETSWSQLLALNIQVLCLIQTRRCQENLLAISPLCVVLAGNPNVGKSAIFNAVTGLNADVSNYPGTTIDVSRAKIGPHEVIDTPGVYGVSSFNDEERIARGIIIRCRCDRQRRLRLVPGPAISSLLCS